MARPVGVYGVGVYLPLPVRDNAWWPAEVVAGWVAARAAKPAPASPLTPTEGVARVMAAMASLADDPFGGAHQRHVMPPGMSASDMEAAASEQALAHADIDRSEVDLLLVHTTVPEYLLSNTACVLHHRLGLPAACLSLQTDAAAYSFLGQLTLAQHMIAAGQARFALLVQSCGVSRLLDHHDPLSPLFGDAATAVVVGAVGAGRGILSAVHRTDGRFPRTLIASVPGGAWYDDGRVIVHSADGGQARQVFLETVDRGKEVVDQALAIAGHQPAEVDFFAVHQGTPWLREVALQHLGLTRARSVETFASTGYVFSASLPMSLTHPAVDDLVVLFGGGTGQTYGATVMRWGR